MKAYWKTPSHMVPFFAMVVSHIAMTVCFLTIVIGGLNADTSAGPWKPNQSESTTALVFFVFVLVTTLYFAIDLIYFLYARKHQKEPEAEIKRDKKERKAMKETLQKNEKESAILEIALKNKNYPYFVVLLTYIRAILGLFITLLVLLPMLIAALFLYQHFGAEPFIMVMLYIALGLCAASIIAILIVPILIRRRVKEGPAAAYRLYDDHLDILDAQGARTRCVIYGTVIKLFSFRKQMSLVFTENGKKVMLFLQKEELGEEGVSLLESKLEK